MDLRNIFYSKAGPAQPQDPVPDRGTDGEKKYDPNCKCEQDPALAAERAYWEEIGRQKLANREHRVIWKYAIHQRMESEARVFSLWVMLESSLLKVAKDEQAKEKWSYD